MSDNPEQEAKQRTFEVSDEVTDMAIGAALDGYAHTQESWAKARDVFYDSLSNKELEKRNELHRVAFALRDALRAASEDAESSEEEAQSRFWNIYDSGEKSDDVETQPGYADDLQAFTTSVEGFLTIDAKSNHVYYENDNNTRVESRDPLGSNRDISIRRKQTEGGVEYEVRDSSHMMSERQMDTYSWSDGAEEVTFNTLGPKLHSRQLSKTEFEESVAHWQELIDVDAEWLEKGKADEKPIRAFGKRALDKVRNRRT